MLDIVLWVFEPLARAMYNSGVRLNELLGAVVIPIATPYRRDRTNDKLFERRPIKISKLLEVQATLAHLVLAKLGQQGSLLLSFSQQQVDHQFSATNGKGCERGLPGSSTLGGVPVGAIADHARSPHSW